MLFLAKVTAKVLLLVVIIFQNDAAPIQSRSFEVDAGCWSEANTFFDPHLKGKATIGEDTFRTALVHLHKCMLLFDAAKQKAQDNLDRKGYLHDLY